MSSAKFYYAILNFLSRVKIIYKEKYLTKDYIYLLIAAGPQSLEDSFLEGAFLGQKAVFGTSIPSQICKNRAFEGLSYNYV